MSGDLSTMSMRSLLMRRRLGRALIEKCQTDWADDDRTPAAIERLREQIRQLTAEVQRRRYPEGPPDQTIELDNLSLKARRH